MQVQTQIFINLITSCDDLSNPKQKAFGESSSRGAQKVEMFIAAKTRAEFDTIVLLIPSKTGWVLIMSINSRE